MNFEFVQLRRWHTLRPYDHFGPTTYCGLSAEGKERHDKKQPGLSCEKCDKTALRIADDDKAAE